MYSYKTRNIVSRKMY